MNDAVNPAQQLLNVLTSDIPDIPRMHRAGHNDCCEQKLALAALRLNRHRVAINNPQELGELQIMSTNVVHRDFFVTHVATPPLRVGNPKGIRIIFRYVF